MLYGCFRTVVKAKTLKVSIIINSLKSKKYNKQSKGVWGMPRLSEAKKDVISCEKLRGLAHTN